VGEIEAAYYADAVILCPLPLSACLRCFASVRVLNTFKSMVSDEDVLEKEDSSILDRMKAFVSSDEVSHFAAAKQLLVLIERAVCI
jgi:hypothetical protein